MMPTGIRPAAVLFLPSWYPVKHNPVHGIFIQNHAIALSKEIPVIVAYPYTTENKLKNINLEINHNENLTEVKLAYNKVQTQLPLIKQIIQLYRYKRACKTLAEHIKNLNYPILAIQVNVVFPACIGLRVFLRYFQVPYTITEHWSGYLAEDGNYKSLFQKYLTKKCITKSQVIWTVSEKQKTAMIGHGLKGNYQHLYNAVNTTIFSKKETKTAPPITLLHVSSLVEREKNIRAMLTALANLKNKKYTFNLIIAGGNSEQIQYTKNIAKEVNLTDIDFKGSLPQEEISYLMSQSHALLLFSNFEGMPVVALEALACELPVLASKAGALPQIIQEGFGILCKKPTISKIENILENFLNGVYSFNYTGMRAFAVKYASYNAVGKQMAKFYKSLPATR